MTPPASLYSDDVTSYSLVITKKVDPRRLGKNIGKTSGDGRRGYNVESRQLEVWYRVGIAECLFQIWVFYAWGFDFDGIRYTGEILLGGKESETLFIYFIPDLYDWSVYN